MSNTKLKALGNWALPINNTTNNQNAGRLLAGRVIVGMLTGHEDDVITSAKKKER
jgi:hypothetical protein